MYICDRKRGVCTMLCVSERKGVKFETVFHSLFKVEGSGPVQQLINLPVFQSLRPLVLHCGHHARCSPFYQLHGLTVISSCTQHALFVPGCCDYGCLSGFVIKRWGGGGERTPHVHKKCKKPYIYTEIVIFEFEIQNKLQLYQEIDMHCS